MSDIFRAQTAQHPPRSTASLSQKSNHGSGIKPRIKPFELLSAIWSTSETNKMKNDNILYFYIVNPNNCGTNHLIIKIIDMAKFLIASFSDLVKNRFVWKLSRML